MLKRTISGIILVAIIVGAIIYSPYSFAILFGIITVLSLWEFYRLFENHLHIQINKPVACLGGLYLFLAGFLYYAKIVPASGIFLPWVIIFLYLSIADIFRNRHMENVHAIAYTFFGQVYIALPLMLLCRIAFQELPAEAINGAESDYAVSYSWYLVLGFYILVWTSDTMAYLCGKLFGKHKLIERISPKKTWEGFIGGILFTAAAALILAHFYPILNLWEWLGFGVIVSVFGLFGDLFESLLKRSIQVKDSGKIIPGHGGMLDRFDSDFLAIPAVALYLFFIL